MKKPRKYNKSIDTILSAVTIADRYFKLIEDLKDHPTSDKIKNNGKFN
jgi:hypothetical protein